MEFDQTEELLRLYGLLPDLSHLEELRHRLLQELRNQDAESSEYLKTLCVQLFALGEVEDSLLIWRASQKSFDTFCYIDVQLLCGAGLEPTKLFLEHCAQSDALEAVAYLKKMETTDFVDFNKDNIISMYKSYYHLD